jgi:hypothetical protein
MGYRHPCRLAFEKDDATRDDLFLEATDALARVEGDTTGRSLF